MTTIALILLLSLVGAGTGFTLGSLLGTTPETSVKPVVVGSEGGATHDGGSQGENTAAGHANDSQAGDDQVAAGDEAEIDQNLSVVPFPPVLTTLAAPPGRWIRLEGSALVRMETVETKEVLAEKAAEQILTYLRTVSLDQMEGPSGLLGLREDINEMVRVLSNDQVRGILIHGLVVE